MNQPKPNKTTGALNTLHHCLTVEEWQRALDVAKAQRASGTPDIDRRNPAQKRHRAVRRCLLRVDRGQAAPGIYVVRSCDISSGGMRLIHGGHVRKGTICCVIIETDRGQSIAAGGVVAWCRPIDDTDPPAYELGVRFYAPVDADGFAEDPSSVSAEDAA